MSAEQGASRRAAAGGAPSVFFFLALLGGAFSIALGGHLLWSWPLDATSAAVVVGVSGFGGFVAAVILTAVFRKVR